MDRDLHALRTLVARTYNRFHPSCRQFNFTWSQNDAQKISPRSLARPKQRAPLFSPTLTLCMRQDLALLPTRLLLFRGLGNTTPACEPWHARLFEPTPAHILTGFSSRGRRSYISYIYPHVSCNAYASPYLYSFLLIVTEHAEARSKELVPVPIAHFESS